MKAEPERIHRTATRIADLADFLWEDVDTLCREAETLMESAWSGDAASSHKALWSEWVDSARQVVGALTADSVLLHQAADAYVATDAANADAIPNSTSGLAL